MTRNTWFDSYQIAKWLKISRLASLGVPKSPFIPTPVDTNSKLGNVNPGGYEHHLYGLHEWNTRIWYKIEYIVDAIYKQIKHIWKWLTLLNRIVKGIGKRRCRRNWWFIFAKICLMKLCDHFYFRNCVRNHDFLTLVVIVWFKPEFYKSECFCVQVTHRKSQVHRSTFFCMIFTIVSQAVIILQKLLLFFVTLLTHSHMAETVSKRFVMS